MTEGAPEGGEPDDRSGDKRALARPSDAELVQHLGAAVMLCWSELPFQAQVKILAHPPSPEGGFGGQEPMT